jgi:hypothetical protein
MRYRLMANYRGVPYEAGVGPSDTDVILFAACPPPEDLGFQPATGHWRKAVSRAEVDGLWESRPSGMFRGEPCLVIDDLGDQLHISYLGNDPFAAAGLGYAELEPGVFEVMAAREEVTSITEERVDYAYPSSPSGGAPSVPPGGGPEPGLVLGSGDVPGAGLEPAFGLEPGLLMDTPLGDALATGLTGELATGLPGTDLRVPYARSTGKIRDISRPPEAAPAPPASAPGRAELPVRGQALIAAQAELPTREQVALPVREQNALPTREQAELPVRRPVEPAAGARAEPPMRGRGRLAARQSKGRASGRRARAGVQPPRAKARQTFTELLELAAVPAEDYALDEIVDGALCLIRTDDGFEVFSAADGVRQEVRFFEDEETAYFYLFGLLAAEAVRDGRLISPR